MKRRPSRILPPHRSSLRKANLTSGQKKQRPDRVGALVAVVGVQGCSEFDSPAKLKTARRTDGASPSAEISVIDISIEGEISALVEITVIDKEMVVKEVMDPHVEQKGPSLADF